MLSILRMSCLWVVRGLNLFHSHYCKVRGIVMNIYFVFRNKYLYCHATIYEWFSLFYVPTEFTSVDVFAYLYFCLFHVYGLLGGCGGVS